MATAETTVELAHIFDVELQATRQGDPVTSPEGRLGDFLGGGTGTVSGSMLNGDVRWDIYCDHNGEVQYDCGNEIAGVIETDDGAEIAFSSLGWARVPDPSKPHRWTMAFAMKFETKAPTYLWLNTTLAHWDGEFDMETFRHSYRVYARSDAQP